MEILYTLGTSSDLPRGGVVTIGNFDGVHLGHQALLAEDKIGTMLPCNVIVQEVADMPGMVEVAAVDPVASMAAVANPQLAAVAQEVRARLQRVVDSL